MSYAFKRLKSSCGRVISKAFPREVIAFSRDNHHEYTPPQWHGHDYYDAEAQVDSDNAAPIDDVADALENNDTEASPSGDTEADEAAYTPRAAVH